MDSETNDRIRELRNAGRECAERGGHDRENPYFEEDNTWEDWEYLAWSYGFRDGRTTDPNCPKCNGTGFLTLRFNEKAREYGDSDIEICCDCNLPRPSRSTPHETQPACPKRRNPP